MVPSFAHPFSKQMAPFSLRLAMCEALASELGPSVQVSDIEGRLPAPSYTVRTLRRLAADHPEMSFRLVIGADNLPGLPRWREADRLQAEFPLLVVGRAGWPAPEGAVVFPEISSTEVRRRLAAGQPVDHLVPASVLGRMGGAYGPAGDVGVRGPAQR